MSPLLLLLACATEPAPPSARAVSGGVEIQATIPIDRVSVRERDGAPLASRSLAVPLDHATVPLRWEPGVALVAEVYAGDRSWSVPVVVPAARPAVALELAAPLGQTGVSVEGWGSYPLTRIEGSQVRVGLTLTANEPARVTVAHDGITEGLALTTALQRETLSWEAPRCAPAPCLASGAVRVEVKPEDPAHTAEITTFLLESRVIPESEAASVLALEGVSFPADQGGAPDLVRPVGRVTLPSAWWTALLRWTGLGTRGRDPEAPWAWQGVELRNSSVTSINVVVRSRVVGPDGAPDPAFRPRLRDADDGTGVVSGLLRVPAGQRASAALPVFVDEPRLGSGPWTREIEVTPLGSDRPLLRWSGPLGVSRGDPLLSAALGLTLLAACAGVGWLVGGLRRWLAAARTSELTTIALFGAMSFAVSAASQLLSMVLSALLGPFAAFVLGIVDDALRAALWATLITLLPRPGVMSVSLVVGYLLRLLALGSMGPVDLLFLGSGMAWNEGCLYLVGLTRGGAWREEPRPRRALRLALGFGLASALGAASNLSLGASFYRLFYAWWYALGLIALPGFLYSAVAAGLATRFADGLRRVEP